MVGVDVHIKIDVSHLTVAEKGKVYKRVRDACAVMGYPTLIREGAVRKIRTIIGMSEDFAAFSHTDTYAGWANVPTQVRETMNYFSINLSSEGRDFDLCLHDDLDLEMFGRTNLIIWDREWI